MMIRHDNLNVNKGLITQKYKELIINVIFNIIICIYNKERK